MDIEAIRKDFPALKEWTYLDTSFVGVYPRQVRSGYDEFLDQWMNFTPSGTKTILSEWMEKSNKVRKILAKFIGADHSEIAYTTCTGSGLNIVINGIDWKKSNNVVFPENEHNPLFTTILQQEGVEPRAINVKNGKIKLSDLEEMVDDNTKLIQVSQVSYINGFRIDLKKVADIAHEHGAKILVDSTQAIGALLTDVKKEKIDFLSAAPYKFLMGPAGLAFMYVSSEHLKDIDPDRVGWKNQIWEGDRAEVESGKKEVAEKFEYGTIHFQGVYGLERSLEYLNKIGMPNIEKRILNLSEYLWKSLESIGKKMYTPRNTKSPIVSFYQKNATRIASELMEQKIKVTGREAHGGHIRVSPHFYNSKEDIDNLIKNLKKS
jgi:selenocysteine lyase/cysteine desulfurase